MITKLTDLDLNKIYSYADYLSWQLEERLELIEGKIFAMSPSPSRRHQEVSWQLSRVIANYFHKKPCKAFAAPFDVRLIDNDKSARNHQEIHTVVQPDICVICDLNKLDEQGCLGAPDWIIEILSKGNSKKEMKLKYTLYETAGVKEYWVVYPFESAILQFVLNTNNKYELTNTFTEDEIASSYLFPDLRISLQEIFNET